MFRKIDNYKSIPQNLQKYGECFSENTSNIVFDVDTQTFWYIYSHSLTYLLLKSCYTVNI